MARRVRPDPDAIFGIYAKVDRSLQHLSALERDMIRFQDGSPYRFERESDAEGVHHRYRLLVDSIPLEWSVIFGEVVHNTRSALDHAVYQLTLDWTGQRLDKTGFPVFRTTAQEFTSRGGAHQIRGIGPGPQTLIKRLQPYRWRRRGPAHHSLLALHEWWNDDKHRLVKPWRIQMRDPQFTLANEATPGACRLRTTRSPLAHRSIVARVKCDPPDQDVKVSGQATASLVVDGAKGTRQGDLRLKDVIDLCGAVAESLGRAIGRQTDEIPIPELLPDPPTRQTTRGSIENSALDEQSSFQ